MKKISTEFAKTFAEEWASSWNSHDIEKILSHYSDDFIIETPMAAKRLPETGGIVKGKEAVKEYWKLGLERNPKLEFEILDVLKGISGLTIYYINKSTNNKAVEVMIFNNQLKVKQAIVHYSDEV